MIAKLVLQAVWDPLLIRWECDGTGQGKLCDYFVPLCAFVIILCDILKSNLIG
jgi:hypothetical protein